MLARITSPPIHDRGPMYAAQALAAVHRGNPRRRPFSLLFGSYAGEVGLFVDTPLELESLLVRQVQGCYPDCRIEPLPPDALDSPEGWRTKSLSLDIIPDIFPLCDFTDFVDSLNHQTADPLMTLLAMIPNETVCRGQVAFHVRPAREHQRRHRERVHRLLTREALRHRPRLLRFIAKICQSRSLLLRPFAAVLLQQRHLTGTLDGTASAKLSQPLFEATLVLTVSMPEDRSREIHARLERLAGGIMAFAKHPLTHFRHSFGRRRRPFLLSAAELASMFHLPTSVVRTERLAAVSYRELEPPARFPKATRHDAVLGRASFRSRSDLVTISGPDRLRHLAIAGKTGQGKSTMLQSLVLADVHAGRGVLVVDPHGDLVQDLARQIPTSRTNDLVLFDAADIEHPIGFNPLVCPDASRRSLIASGVLSAFAKMYGNISWGPRLEHFFRHALLALLEAPNPSLVSIVPLFTNAGFRRRVLDHVRDPVVRNFWTKEFDAMPPKLQVEAMSPVLNKVGHFVGNPILRNILGQTERTLDLRMIFDKGQVVLVDLAKGRIGDDASRLLGSLLITSLATTAMGRADLPQEQRSPFFLYVDEAHCFATDAFQTILSEGRKYGLAFGGLATQFLEQFDPPTLAAIIGNCGSFIAFQSGQRDSEILAQQLGGDLTPADLMGIPKYHAYVRLLVDGQPSRPFSMKTLAPERRSHRVQSVQVLRRTSRHRFAKPLSEVQETITHLVTT